MSRRAASITAAMLLAGVGLWVVAQTQSTRALDSLFPGGPVAYVEAKDFSALLADWNASAEKKQWLASANYEVFSRTRLLLRLTDAQAEFAQAAGFPADMPLVNSVAGAQSALAVYDIGELEFLYVTRLDASRALNSVLFGARGSYEARRSGGFDYYVRRAAGRTAAFAAADGFLFLATREDLVASALALLARTGSMPALAAADWYAPAVRASAGAGDVRIALHLRALVQSPYFRSYWIQRNVSSLRQYSSGVIDLVRGAGEYREDRVFIRSSPAEPGGGGEAAVAQVAAWAPPEAGFERAWASPAVGDAAALIRAKIVAPGAQSSPESRLAPEGASPDAVVGSAGDLETRIDQPPLDTGPGVDPTDAFRRAASGLELRAILHVQNSTAAPDGVFIGNESAVAILASGDWPAFSLPNAFIERRGAALIVASTPGLLQALSARLATPAPAEGGVYMARYRHARELEPFTRMMRLLDHSRQPQADGDGGMGPPFFSGNVASLGRVLGRIQDVSVVARDEGALVRQRVVYRIR